MKRLTADEITEIVEKRIYEPKLWYKSNLTAKSYCEVASRAILNVTRASYEIPEVYSDCKCNYNRGKRAGKREEMRSIVGDMKKLQSYVDNLGAKVSRREERMCHCMYAQAKAGEYEVIDYQVPTSDGGHDKIDLVLRRGKEVFITETKWFASTETILRCVLEIQTYYQKLNGKFYTEYGCDKDSVRKAVLVDKDSVAFEQAGKEWARELMRHFGVTLLLLSRSGTAFEIGDCSDN